MISFNQLKEIAEKNPDGFTIDLWGNHIVFSSGHRWVVATRETLGMTIDNFDDVLSIAQYTGFIGGWKDDDGVLHIDAVNIFNMRYKESFILDMARARNQVSVYDLMNKKVVYVDYDKKMTREEELTHRIRMIEDDMNALCQFIYSKNLMETFTSSPTPYCDEAWTHINNIAIACNLSDDESLNWTRFSKSLIKSAK